MSAPDASSKPIFEPMSEFVSRHRGDLVVIERQLVKAEEVPLDLYKPAPFKMGKALGDMLVMSHRDRAFIAEPFLRKTYRFPRSDQNLMDTGRAPSVRTGLNHWKPGMDFVMVDDYLSMRWTISPSQWTFKLFNTGESITIGFRDEVRTLGSNVVYTQPYDGRYV